MIAAAVVVAASTLAQAQPAPDAAGDWRSTLSQGGVSLRLALHLGAVSTFDSADQGAFGLSAKMTVEGRRVSVAIDKVGVFEGELSTDGQTLTGALKQGPTSTPLVFRRGGIAAANRPQTPAKPYPYVAVEAAYDNPVRPGVRLAGTLTVPSGVGPFPAVVLITGSGAQDRDETIFEHKPFLVLADALTRRGIAVLRVDDRGMGGSTGGSADATSADLATDVEAGVNWLRKRAEIDPRRIGLIGHSEGGIIAPMVAGSDPGVAFIVLWAGPGVSGAQVVSEQVRALNLAAGLPQATADHNAQAQAAILAALLANPDNAKAGEAMSKAAVAAGGAPLDARSIALMTSHWYRAFIAYDPAPALRAVKVPVLALVGGKDTQVTAAQNLTPLKAALAGNPKAKVVELPGLNHMFQTAQTGSVEEYGKLEETIAPMALKTIGDWVVQVSGARGP